MGNELGSLIPQRDLSPEIEERLRSEIRSPVHAATCLQKVQIAATFIVNSRESLSSDTMGEVKLAEDLSSVLAEGRNCLPSATACSEVCLFHVDAFVRLVKRIINHDPMECLPVRYK